MKKLAGAVFLLSLTAAGALAQPAMPPAASAAADQSLVIRAEVQAARAQARASSATREQIRAIRAALRARLAALHH